jgi:DNA-binding MarR family transcriptional regulator
MVEQKSEPKARDEEPVDLGILLGLGYQTFCDLLRADLKAHGFDDLGGAYGYVFRVLADEPLSQRELARRLGITDQGMAKIVNEMVARRYVERHADPDDSRINRLRLGARGRAALRAARRFHATFESELGRDLGESAVRRLRETLDRIATRGGDVDVARSRLRPM